MIPLIELKVIFRPQPSSFSCALSALVACSATPARTATTPTCATSTSASAPRTRTRAASRSCQNSRNSPVSTNISRFFMTIHLGYEQLDPQGYAGKRCALRRYMYAPLNVHQYSIYLNELNWLTKSVNAISY